MTNYAAYTTGEKLTAAKLNQRLPSWLNLQGTGTAVVNDSFNVTLTADNGTGDYTVAFTTDFSNASWCAVFGAEMDPGVSIRSCGIGGDARAAGSIQIECCLTSTGAAADSVDIEMVVFGDNEF